MESRLYVFANMYMNGVHAGIQGLHATVRLMRKYSKMRGKTAAKQLKKVNDWADLNETAIVLNGGPSVALRELIAILEMRKNELPWAKFNEDQASLDGALTAVAVVVPASLYEVDLNEDTLVVANLTTAERDFLIFKSHCGLAK